MIPHEELEKIERTHKSAEEAEQSKRELIERVPKILEDAETIFMVTHDKEGNCSALLFGKHAEIIISLGAIMCIKPDIAAIVDTALQNKSMCGVAMSCKVAKREAEKAKGPETAGEEKKS